MPSIQWKSPSPLWTAGANAPDQPWIAEFDGDKFLTDFRQLMAGQMPGKIPGNLGDMMPQDRSGDALKLYQPMHGRYYFVTASLICRQLGLPDRAVAKQNGDRTSFVLRRSVTVGVPQEQAWVSAGANSGWQPLVDQIGNAVPALPNEERFPLHAAPVCFPKTNGNGRTTPGPFGLSACNRRSVYYGYIPVSSRDKYLPKFVTPSADSAEDLKNFMQQVQKDSALEGDYRLGEVDDRVIEPWRAMYVGLPPDPLKLDPNKLEEVSLYLLLDLADFLDRALPSVSNAIAKSDSTSLNGASNTARKALYDELNNIYIPANANPPSGNMKLASAIKNLYPYLGLVRGQDIEEPVKKYNLKDAPKFAPNPTPANAIQANGAYLDTLNGQLHNRFKAALSEEDTPMQPSIEATSLLQDQVRTDSQVGDVYHVRLVYERKGCPPIVSAPSPDFTFARPFDPDAPARHIQIELPSINLKDMARYKRGVGLKMSPQLRDVMNRINKDMLSGGDLSPSSGGLELGMICSFSLQIIFLVAFIVMFIFLIAFNFIFWWLLFLKICFPIPKKAS